MEQQNTPTPKPYRGILKHQLLGHPEADQAAKLRQIIAVLDNDLQAKGAFDDFEPVQIHLDATFALVKELERAAEMLEKSAQRLDQCLACDTPCEKRAQAEARAKSKPAAAW